MPPSASSAAVLERYAAQYGLPMARDAASILLLVDGCYSLRLRALRGTGVMVSARLRGLPAPGPARDDLLLAFARLACGTMQAQPTTCSVDARARAIWLQLTAPALSVEDIDAAIGTFVNSLAFWARISRSL